MQKTKQSPLERYVSALEAIAAAAPAGLGLSELSQRCHLPLATTYRVLQTLRNTALVVPSGKANKEYVLAPRLLRLLHAGADDGWLSIAMQPILDRLAQELNETCFVARLVGRQIVSIAWAVPEAGLQSNVVPGDVMPPHASASAKAILAFQSDALVDEILAGSRLQSLTPKTKVKPAVIKADYARVRSLRYATCWQEMEMGLGAVACPIEVAGVGVVYAIAVTGLADRLKRHPIDSTVALLRSASERLALTIEHALRDEDHSPDAPSAGRALRPAPSYGRSHLPKSGAVASRAGGRTRLA